MDTRQQEGMAAQIKKVTLNPNVVHLEFFLPDRGNQPFQFALRRHHFRRRLVADCRGRERLAVYFPTWRQGQRMHLHKGCGNHVIRRLALQVGAQGGR